jgi:hypothetical protein
MIYANNCAFVSRASEARRQIGEAAGAVDDGVELGELLVAAMMTAGSPLARE